MRRKRVSLTLRLTLLFACTSAAVLLALGFLIGALVQQHFEELDAEAINGKLEQIGNMLRSAQTRRDLDALPQQSHILLFGHPALDLKVFSVDGQALVASSTVVFPAPLRAPPARATPPEAVSWSTPDGMHYRGMALAVPTGIDGLPTVIAAAAMNMAPHEEFMKSFQKTMWSVVVLAALLSGVLGWIAVRRSLAPVRMIRQRAAEITANQLDQRLSAEAVPAELDELVRTLNDMLARLEDSFRRLSDFSSDLAHELRTPVTNMRTQTQVILSKPRTAERYRDVLYSNAEEFERLSRMISDMLFLAKSDHGLVAPDGESIDLAAEICDLFSFFEALAEGRDVSLALAGQGRVVGDKMLLRRAFSNVLANAIRHTPEHGEVRVEIHQDAAAGSLLLSVCNTGTPIPAVHIPRLFDRFYRVNESAGGASEGSGLGLAITKSIIELHGGSIGVRSADGLTCFDIRLPQQRVLQGDSLRQK